MTIGSTESHPVIPILLFLVVCWYLNSDFEGFRGRVETICSAKTPKTPPSSRIGTTQLDSHQGCWQPVDILDENYHSPKRFFFPEAFLSYVNLAFESGTVPIILLPSFPATVWDQRIWFWLLDAAMSLIRNHYPRLASRKKVFWRCHIP